jgi:hypothetical protein
MYAFRKTPNAMKTSIANGERQFENFHKMLGQYQRIYIKYQRKIKKQRKTKSYKLCSLFI